MHLDCISSHASCAECWRPAYELAAAPPMSSASSWVILACLCLLYLADRSCADEGVSQTKGKGEFVAPQDLKACALPGFPGEGGGYPGSPHPLPSLTLRSSLALSEALAMAFMRAASSDASDSCQHHSVRKQACESLWINGRLRHSQPYVTKGDRASPAASAGWQR